MEIILNINEVVSLETQIRNWREQFTETLNSIARELAEDERAYATLIENPEENGYVNQAEYNFDGNELTLWLPSDDGLIRFVIELSDEEADSYSERIAGVSDFTFVA